MRKRGLFHRAAFLLACNYTKVVRMFISLRVVRTSPHGA